MAGKKILNVGCGNSFEGTDRIDFMKTPATTKICDIEEDGLPYKDNTFDEIICYRILEHIRNMKSLMNECFRVLKKGGKISLQTDNAGYIILYIKSEHNAYIENKAEHHKDDHHYHLFVPSHLRYLFERAGFHDIKISYVSVQRNPLKKLFLTSLPFNMGKEEIRVEAIK